jgi:hypothetical protein
MGIVSLNSNTSFFKCYTAELPGGRFLSHYSTILACRVDCSRMKFTSISSNGDTCHIWTFFVHPEIEFHSFTLY